MASTPGFEPRPHWWEKSALTTAPPFPPRRVLIKLASLARNATLDLELWEKREVKVERSPQSMRILQRDQ